MENKTFLEKAFLIIGAIILAIGLFMFIDISSIGKELILVALVVANISTYVTALKIKTNYTKTAHILSFVAWILAICSFYLLASILNLHNIQSFIPIMIGVYSLYVLKDFCSKYFIFALSLWSCSSSLIFDTNEVVLVLVNLFTIYFVLRLVQLYISKYKPNFIVSLLHCSILIFTSGYCILNFFSIFNIDMNIEHIVLIDVIVFITIIYKKYLENFRTYKDSILLYLCCTSFYLSTSSFWEGIVSEKLVLTATIIAFTFMLLVLIKLTLSGSTLSFVLIFIHIIIFFTSNVLEYVSTAVFLMLLGGVLISIGYWLEKTRLKGGKDNVE